MIALKRTYNCKVPQRHITGDIVSVRLGSAGGLKTQVGKLANLPCQVMGYAKRQDSARLIARENVVRYAKDRLFITTNIALSLESKSSIKVPNILSPCIHRQTDDGLAYLFKSVEPTSQPGASCEYRESVRHLVNSVLRRQTSADINNTDKTF